MKRCLPLLLLWAFWPAAASPLALPDLERALLDQPEDKELRALLNRLFAPPPRHHQITVALSHTNNRNWGTSHRLLYLTLADGIRLPLNLSPHYLPQPATSPLLGYDYWHRLASSGETFAFGVDLLAGRHSEQRWQFHVVGPTNYPWQLTAQERRGGTHPYRRLSGELPLLPGGQLQPSLLFAAYWPKELPQWTGRELGFRLRWHNAATATWLTLWADQPLSQERPGGTSRRLTLEQRWQITPQIRLQLFAEAGRDTRPYSPFLSPATPRQLTMVGAQLSYEIPLSATGPSLGLNASHLRQRSNLPLFDRQRSELTVALRWRW